MQVGVALPLAEAADGQTPGYRESRDFARQAEAGEFDSVWVFDHLLFRFPEQPTRGIWEAWTTLTGIAEATERINLGTLVLCTAFRNPALLAKMIDALDEISEGRLIVGLGAGWHDPEFEAFGLPHDRLVSRFEEALAIICPLVRTGEVDFTGELYQAPNCVSRPRGPRPAGPPILIGAFGPRMMRLTARYADAWNTCWLGEPGPLAERRGELDAACEDEGRDPATIETTVGIYVGFPDLESLPEHLSGPGAALVGDASAIAAGLQGFADAGVDQAICWLSPATLPALAQLTAALKLFRGA